MSVRKLCLSPLVLAALVLAPPLAWAEGLGLGETKEELKLKYDVTATDYGSGFVTLQFTITDQGRLAPLDRGVEMVVPGMGGSGVDFALQLESRKPDGKPAFTIQLRREQAERAEILLKTGTLDGKQEPLTWYFHRIPVAQYLKAAGEKKK